MARDPLQDVAAHLNTIKSVGQERAAIGAALSFLHTGYEAARKLPYWSDYNEGVVVRELDAYRLPLEAIYNKLPSGKEWQTKPVDSQQWPGVHQQILAAYTNASGPIGAGGGPTLKDAAGYLWDAIVAAPALVLETAKNAAKAVTAAAAEVAASAGKGLFFGFLPIIVVVIVIFIVLAKLKVLPKLPPMSVL